jgi:hypothetical protein
MKRGDDGSRGWGREWGARRSASLRLGAAPRVLKITSGCGVKSSTKGGVIWYKIEHDRKAKACVDSGVLTVMSEQGFDLDSLGENRRLAWDRGWRIWKRAVSGKRTVPQGESRLIKANPSEMRDWGGLMKELGRDVGECGGDVRPRRSSFLPRGRCLTRNPRKLPARKARHRRHLKLTFDPHGDRSWSFADQCVPKLELGHEDNTLETRGK